MSRREKKQPTRADFTQSRSFNVGVAMEVSIGAALIYDELVFFADKGSRGDGWIYKEYADLVDRFPFMGERSIRRYVRELEQAKYIETKIMRRDSRPILHIKITKLNNMSPVEANGQNGRNGQDQTAKMAETIVPAKMAETIYTSTNTATNITQQVPAAKQTTAERRQNLLAAVNRICGREFKVLPDRGVKKTLDAFSDEEIERALTTLAADEWHQPRLKELSIDYFTRSTTIDKFAQKALAIAPLRTISNEEIEAMRAEQNAALRARRDKMMALKMAGGVA